MNNSYSLKVRVMVMERFEQEEKKIIKDKGFCLTAKWSDLFKSGEGRYS